MQKRRVQIILRGAAAALLCAAVLKTVSVMAPAKSAESALCAAEWEEELARILLRAERGDIFTDDGLHFSSALALSMQPILLTTRDKAMSAWSGELQEQPDAAHDSEDEEGTVLAQPKAEEKITVADNGMTARTLKPNDPKGYLIYGRTYINNGSESPLDSTQLGLDFSASLSADGPQVLIIHTHSTEAYTMPPGEEYELSDNHRTLDTSCNMIRVGDEIAQVLTNEGISVLHDRSLYDYPSYSGAYNRSLASIESYLARYPSISFVLDVHRDAVEDANGNEYKLLSEEEPTAAQLEFVIGSDGGGMPHGGWRDNLKLACAVQENILAEYPTLMRPIVVRNSRYNQHMTAGSLLLEVGTAGNSLEEALVSARIFAHIFARTVKK